MSECLSQLLFVNRRRMVSIVTVMIAGCSTTESRLLPTLADSYVLLDAPPDPSKTSVLSNIVDMRTVRVDSRVVTSTAVALGDKDLQTDLIESIRAEIYEYALTQWKSSDVLKTLASRPIHVSEFVLSYTVGLQGSRPVDLSLGPAVAAFDQLMRSAMGQLGDFRLRLTLKAGERIFLGSERHQFGANGGVVPSYSSRSLFKKVVHSVAAQMVTQHTA